MNARMRMGLVACAFGCWAAGLHAQEIELSQPLQQQQQPTEPLQSMQQQQPMEPLQPPPVRRPLFAPKAVAQAHWLAPAQREEWRFLKYAAATSRFQHTAAQLALARSHDAQVLRIAARLASTHADAGPFLNHALQARQLVPPMLSTKQRDVLRALAASQGTRFDRIFLEEVATRSRLADVQAYERASRHVDDPALKAWLDASLPGLRDQATAMQAIKLPVDPSPQVAAVSPMAPPLPATFSAANSR